MAKYFRKELCQDGINLEVADRVLTYHNGGAGGLFCREGAVIEKK